MASELFGPHDRQCCDAGFRRRVVALPEIAGAGQARDIDDAAAAALANHALGRFAAAQEYARQVDVDDGLPLLEAQLAGDLAVLGFDEQPVAQDAGVGDAAVETAEVGDDAVERADDVALGSDVRRVGLGAHAERAASVAHGARPAASRSTSARLAPRAASLFAIAAPSPRPAPVIKIVLAAKVHVAPRRRALHAGSR